ncbi:hypothetical protein VPNG_10325 [Cytospora leucostoma]|uniref:Uncharacterized protein n=1 Tax=Cytospora leucostoma TaxID=1230097 RepID=A0A423VBI6_9PEZI|nr:hypothetical protein VPNG_10325 [Cytospora leucostoma]
MEFIGEDSEWPNSETVMQLAEKRPTSSGASAFLSQTIIGFTNKLGFSKAASFNDSIGRRVIIYRIAGQEAREAEAFSKDLFNNRKRLQFIDIALSIPSLDKRAQVQLEMALQSELKKSISHISARMIIDPMATPAEFRSATALMTVRVESESRSSGCWAPSPPGRPGIRTIKFTPTFAGRQYVFKNWGKETISTSRRSSRARRYSQRTTTNDSINISNMSTSTPENKPVVATEQPVQTQPKTNKLDALRKKAEASHEKTTADSIRKSELFDSTGVSEWKTTGTHVLGVMKNDSNMITIVDKNIGAEQKEPEWTPEQLEFLDPYIQFIGRDANGSIVPIERTSLSALDPSQY